MEKRVIIAFVLALALLIAWQFLFPPPKQEPPAPAVQEQSVMPIEEPQEEALSLQPELPAEELQEEEVGLSIREETEREITLENSLYQITFSNRGGAVVSWRLREHLKKNPDKSFEPLELVSSVSKNLGIYPLQIKTRDAEIDNKLNTALHETTTEKVSLTDHNGERVSGQRIIFKHADGLGLYVEKVLEVPDEGYLTHVGFTLLGVEKSINPSIVWGAGFGQEEQNSNRFYYSGQAIANIAGNIDRIATKKVKEERILSGGMRWVGLEDQYFGIFFIPQSHVDAFTLSPSTFENKEGKEEKVLTLAVPQVEAGYDLYVGPKDYHILRDVGYDLKYAVNFGSIIGPIALGLFHSLVWLYENVSPNYGLAIIIVTVLIRILFFPLTQKSFVSMKKMQTNMQRVQPKINAIKTKYKKKGLDFQSRQKMNQEIMDLYKKEGINPMGGMTGCFPLLLQLPILWAFFNVLRAAVELRQAPFILWIGDLSVMDPYYITPILMGATMFIQQIMSGSAIGDPFQRRMMYMMPLIFTFFFLSFPSGLVLYWLVNNVLGIGQQYLINKQAKKVIDQEKSNKEKGKSKRR
jgi:YidC/Oxa1 family membrane protein insertase